MATYFSLYNGNFTDGVFGKTLAAGDVTAGTLGNMLSTGYNYSGTVASDGSTYYGVALHLSARNASPTGTLDLILSAANGVSQTVSYPVSSFTGIDGSNNITQTYPLGWQLLTLSSPLTISNAVNMKIGVKTSSSNQVSLIGTALSNLDRLYVTTLTAVPAAGDVVHVGGQLTNTGSTPITVNYNSTGTGYFGNFYVHNDGTLNFDPTVGIVFNLSGAGGMQVTPGGVVNFGSNSSQVSNNIVHTVNLNSSYINVNNGGSFNVYGADKTQFAYLAANSNAGANTFTTSTDISNWVSNASVAANGDYIVVTPHVSSATTFDGGYLSATPSSTSAKLWTNTTYPHVASTYIPGLVNMTRNVKFLGSGASYGYVRFLDGSTSSINNAYFQNFNNSTYKGISFGTSSTGSVTLNNCVLSGTNVASTPAFSFARTPAYNVTLQNCNFYNFGATTNIVSFDSLSAHNINFSNNIVLKSSQNGIYINALSSNNSLFSSNHSIGNTQNGVYVNNPYILSGSVGAFGSINAGCGFIATGTLTSSKVTYSGIGGFYNPAQGLNIVGTNPSLSTNTVFTNISAFNNTLAGVAVSGNSVDVMSPITLYINGLVSDNNKVGMEAYSIAGNLSSMSFTNNYWYGLKSSIGNKAITFDGLTALGTLSTNSAGVGFLSGTNFYPVIIKNANIRTTMGGGSATQYGISLSSTKFEQFIVESSTLSGASSDVNLANTTGLIEGSYIFNNCTFGTGILSSSVISNYQPEVFLETGFGVMKNNGNSNDHYRMLASGKISTDTVNVSSGSVVSERLTPFSATVKLRSGSKMIPVNYGDALNISVYVMKSASYSGDAPRLMLKRNSAIGYSDTVLATSVGANGSWELLSATLPTASDAGIVEVYVDCSGAAGSGFINIDNWNIA